MVPKKGDVYIYIYIYTHTYIYTIENHIFQLITAFHLLPVTPGPSPDHPGSTPKSYFSFFFKKTHPQEELYTQTPNQPPKRLLC